MGLARYKAKRDLKVTPEPAGAKKHRTGAPLAFVVQRHKASHLHYDFRLELDGVLKSWAVPKGPSMAPEDKRLAMMVEDHPFDYKDFHGVIPEGQYGAGIVEIWDRGTYVPLHVPEGSTAEQAMRKGLKAGSIKVILKGRKLKGEFALVRFKNAGENGWLLLKHDDDHAVKHYDSEKETPKNSPINKALAKKTPARKRAVKKAARKSAKRRTRVANARAPQAVAETPRRFTLRGIGSATKVDHPIKPMLAAPDVSAFDGDDWLFEIKWDGYRAIAETGGKDLRFYSRNGLSFAEAYPTVADELRRIRKKLVLDGEVVAVDKQGRPSFQQLQHATQDPDTHLIYYVFDLLAEGGKDLTRKPLTERKKRLRTVLKNSDHIRYCDHVEGNGKAFFQAAVRQDLEGIIAKRADSTYHKGVRSKEWLKIKNHRSQEAVIGGYTAPRNSRKHFGALLLGVYEKGKLRYVGHTGTGFDHKGLDELMTMMHPLKRATSPFSTEVEANMPPVWVRPKLVCNVKFTEWTRDGHMRHPVFLGLRTDKAAKDVKLEPMATKKKTATKSAARKVSSRRTSAKRATAAEDEKHRDVRVGRNTVHLTNLQKVFWPKEGFTKGDVLAYYEQMAPVLLPYLKDRPQSLHRMPGGINGMAFYQKNAGGEAPAWVPSVKVPSKSRGSAVDYLLCNDLAGLLYIVNLGCIELNPWTSRKGHLIKPDHLVLDLDPSDKNSFDDVVDAALAVKQVLDAISVEGYCKTSGASGLHIYIPTGARYTYKQLAPFAKDIMLAVNDLLPDTTTLTRSLSKRSKRHIYLDHLQNRKGQTLASVYSIRPKAGATVSTPLEWKEVKHGLDHTTFTIETIRERVGKKGDLFAPILKHKGFALDRAVKALRAMDPTGTAD